MVERSVDAVVNGRRRARSRPWTDLCSSPVTGSVSPAPVRLAMASAAPASCRRCQPALSSASRWLPACGLRHRDHRSACDVRPHEPSVTRLPRAAGTQCALHARYGDVSEGAMAHPAPDERAVRAALPATRCCTGYVKIGRGDAGLRGCAAATANTSAGTQPGAPTPADRSAPARRCRRHREGHRPRRPAPPTCRSAYAGRLVSLQGRWRITGDRRVKKRRPRAPPRRAPVVTGATTAPCPTA